MGLTLSELLLTNPHSILQTLKYRPKEIGEIFLGDSRPSDIWGVIHQEATRSRVKVITKDNKSGSKGFHARVRPKAQARWEDLFSDDEQNGIWLALDCLQDPHNVGAVFRSAAFFGVKGILLSQDRSAPLSSTVYDVASGGMECVPFCIEINLVRSLQKAKEKGVWILGTSEHAKESLFTVKPDRRWLVVIGSEEKGMRSLTEKNCDQIVKIPAAGGVSSLNASVAAGIILSHLSQK